MFALLWFSGIGDDTSMRDIGWTYVFIILGLVFIVVQVRKLIKE
jgi:hypothetical protein